METDAIIGKLRKEVGEIVTELNGTTERNVALLENRIAALNDLLEKAGKTSGALKRESEKHEISSRVYTALERSRPLAPSLNLDVVEEGGVASRSLAGTGSAVGPEPALNNTGDPGQDRPHDTDAGTGRTGENRPLEAGKAAGATANDHSGEIAAPSNLSVRERALVMHRNGDSTEKIGSVLGLSAGEVELIISLHERRVY